MKALWTPDQAREMAIRGNLAKAKIRAAIREASTIASQVAFEATYTDRVKARVRAQVLITLERIEEENARGSKCDGAKLDRLASALERLAELERVLDGRPNPGTRRPREEPTPKSDSRPEPQHLGAASAPSPAPVTTSPSAPAPTPRPTTPPSQAPHLTEPPDF